MHSILQIFNIFWPSLHTKFNLNDKKHSNMKANSASKHRKIPSPCLPCLRHVPVQRRRTDRLTSPQSH